MKTLGEIIKKNGFKYFIVDRSDKAAIYEQKKNGIFIAYEVFKIKIKHGSKKLNIDEYEGFPVNEDFGEIAWSVKSLEEAKLIYNDIK